MWPRRATSWAILSWLAAWMACTVDFDPALLDQGSGDGDADADADGDSDADGDGDGDADADGDADGDGDADADADGDGDGGVGLDAGPDGAVECSGNQTACDGQCVDLRSDRQNCGACGNACSNGRPCCGSRCTDNCQ